jgi:cytochrome c556
MLKWISFSLLLFAAANAQALDSKQAKKAIEVREAVMTITGWNIVPAAGMVKEKIPYDAREFQIHAERLHFAMSMVADAFKTDTRGFGLKTEAMDKIWEDNEEFLRLAKEAEDASAALAAAAASGNFAEVKEPFMEVGKTCKACHDEFKEED